MDGADLCFEIVKRADAGFVYSEAVARYVICINSPEVKVEIKEGNNKNNKKCPFWTGDEHTASLSYKEHICFSVH